MALPKKNTIDKIILGIDPGTVIMGYGLIHVLGSEMKLLSLGVIKLNKLEDHYMRLQKIFERVTAIIDEYKVDELAIEAPFFGKNVQSMLKLGRAQGVAIAAAVNRKIPVFEYAPKKIKISVAGNGNASKEQLSAMLTQLLGVDKKQDYLDATDALGAAVCHYFQTKGLGGNAAKKAFTGWKAFLTENPNRKV
jgi:crossover junction endodeoxyribonuclease RuvC